MTATQPLTETTVLANDVKMPTIGFGTWQIPINENFDSTIQTAIQLGYRQFDTAQIYNNAQRMGEAIRASDVPRSEFFLTSKIWASHRSYESAREAYELILTQMQTDYLDLLLIHWPAAQGEPMVWQAQNAGAWRALEELYTEGRVRAIGVSNFLPHHLVPLLARARVKPMVNQLEIHPGYAQRPPSISAEPRAFRFRPGVRSAAGRSCAMRCSKRSLPPTARRRPRSLCGGALSAASPRSRSRRFSRISRKI